MAKIFMKQQSIQDLDMLASRYVSDRVEAVEEALQGARDIIAEWLNEKEGIRSRIRRLFQQTAIVESKIIKAKEKEEAARKFSNYFDFSESLKRSPSHRLLA